MNEVMQIAYLDKNRSNETFTFSELYHKTGLYKS